MLSLPPASFLFSFLDLVCLYSFLLIPLWDAAQALSFVWTCSGTARGSSFCDFCEAEGRIGAEHFIPVSNSTVLERSRGVGLSVEGCAPREV